MNKPTIAVDIDEVLFPLLSTFFPYLKAKHGIDVRQEQMKTYRTEDVIGGTVEELLAKMDDYLQTEHYENALPVKGAAMALKELHKKYRLVVITARHKTFRGLTERFIETHFKGLFDAIRYTHDEDNPEIETTKFEICQQEKAIVLIDDNLTFVLECAKVGFPVVLFGDYAWNQLDKLPEGIVRCNDWLAVVEYFKRAV